MKVSMQTGMRLDHYRMVAPIGAGGMGEVYRATDTKLNRDVAIKVLPTEMEVDPERLARFEREAKLLASLNHPNIAHVYGFEKATLADGSAVHFLAMELVEGEDLAARLKRGAIPLDEALLVAKHMAEALEEAHDKGIVHRDLKPANVKLTPDGKVKVLDFGLAKAYSGESMADSAPDVSQSPTLAHAGTQAGVILGTAAYMSPEQARGKPVDKRADIWAFGVVLYEMLTGRQLFAGETVSDVLAEVLKTDIDFERLPDAMPPGIRRLLRRCLDRQPKNRLHDIADARIVLDEVLAGSLQDVTVTGLPRPARSRLWIALPWLLVAGLAAFLVVILERAPGGRIMTERRALEFSVPLGKLLADDAQLAFAPDGSAIVFTALDPSGREPVKSGSGVAVGQQLWLRYLDRFDATPLHDTVGANFPFWSPDGRSIGFFRDDDATLCRYDMATGAVEILTRVKAGARGGSWGTDGTILFAESSNAPIRRLDTNRRTVEDITQLDPKIIDGSHRFPILLPDGQHFLFTVWSNHLESATRVGGVYLGSLEKGLERRLTADLSQAILVGRDRILVRRSGALVALPFDLKTLTVVGSGTKIVDQPRFSASSGALAAAATATGDIALALASGETGGELVWLDRQGQKVGTFGLQRLRAQILVLAPDDRTFAVQAVSATGLNIWIGDTRRQVIDRLTPDAIDANNPVWSPDARRIAFSTEAEGNASIYVQEADGSRNAQLLLSEPERDFTATGWSPNGQFLLLESKGKSELRTDLWLYDFEAGKARELLSEPAASLSEATLSNDGSWLSYTSDESGNPEVFVRPFPALDRKWKISQGGAVHPHWRRDGRELLFVGFSDKAVMAVDVAVGREGLEVGMPHRLFAPGSQLLGLAATADHDRFLAGVIPADVRAEPVRVLLGWRQAVGTESTR